MTDNWRAGTLCSRSELDFEPIASKVRRDAETLTNRRGIARKGSAHFLSVLERVQTTKIHVLAGCFWLS